MAYTVIRTDLMSGTKQPADMVSFRFYNDGQPAAVENGVIVKLEALEEGEREVYKAVAATNADDLNDCAIVAGVEVEYDERRRNLDEYINEAGKIVRGYLLRRGNVFGITKEGFSTGEGPEAKATVGIAEADGKINPAGSGLGVCIAVEPAGRYTYHVIKIAKGAV